MSEVYAYQFDIKTCEVIGERILLESTKLSIIGIICVKKNVRENEEFYYIPPLKNYKDLENVASFLDMFEPSHPNSCKFKSRLLHYYNKGAIAKTTYEWLSKRESLINIDSLFNWLDNCIKDEKTLSLKKIKDDFSDENLGCLKRPCTDYMTRYKPERDEDEEDEEKYEFEDNDDDDDDERYFTCRE